MKIMTWLSSMQATTGMCWDGSGGGGLTYVCTCIDQQSRRSVHILITLSGGQLRSRTTTTKRHSLILHAHCVSA